MGTHKASAPPSMVTNAAFARAGLSMPRDAQLCLRGNSDIFVQTPNTPSTLYGRDLPASKNGTATNGVNVFPITRMVAAPRVNGPRTIFLGAAGGAGSFRCNVTASALGSFMIAQS